VLCERRQARPQHGELDLKVRSLGRTREQTVAEKSDDTTVARANLVEQIACDDARLSAVEKIRRINGKFPKIGKWPRATAFCAI
jgi:hypothetical protein